MVWRMNKQKSREARSLRNNRNLVRLSHKQGAHSLYWALQGPKESSSDRSSANY